MRRAENVKLNCSLSIQGGMGESGSGFCRKTVKFWNCGKQVTISNGPNQIFNHTPPEVFYILSRLQVAFHVTLFYVTWSHSPFWYIKSPSRRMRFGFDISIPTVSCGFWAEIQNFWFNAKPPTHLGKSIVVKSGPNFKMSGRQGWR